MTDQAVGSPEASNPSLAAVDPRVAELIVQEARRQATKLQLIPSENYASRAVMEACGSVLTNKYSEGYPGRRYYEGQQVVDQVEGLAIQRAKDLFGVEHANVQPYSGSPANLAIYLAYCQPGDTVMGMALPMGGHLTHGWNVSVTGRWFHAVQYGVRRDTGIVDLDEVRDLAVRERPKLIFCGGTAIPRTIDFAGFAEIAAEVGALLVADIAHVAGLVVGGVHPSPVGHAQVISTTTHKTLRGPRGAMLLCGSEHAQALDRAVFPGLQGGPHDHTTAGIAVALHEAAQPRFRHYAAQVVANAKRLAQVLAERGFDLVSGGTDNHLLLIDLTGKGVEGKPAAQGLDRAGLVANYNTVPYDPRKPFNPSGVRLGTPSVTSRGMGPAEMELIGRWIDEGVQAVKARDEATLDRIAAEVAELAGQFPPPGIPLDSL
ncbi:MAG TPA: serine hydroxymethyltransferase [Actinomycetes bacterium]|jgi:glycine hydroxymethyltransferase|nr:serine hydroxymethyltransferase [Actinomycetes bacterium]